MESANTNFEHAFDLDISRALRRCFKYTQERLKVIYKSYLAFNRKNETPEERKQRKKEEKMQFYECLKMEHPQSHDMTK